MFILLFLSSFMWVDLSYVNEGLELWCLMPLSTIYYCGGQFIMVEETEYPEKTTNLPQVTLRQTLSHNVVQITSHHERDSNSQL
jgi:hypothetical protein